MVATKDHRWRPPPPTPISLCTAKLNRLWPSPWNRLSRWKLGMWARVGRVFGVCVSVERGWRGEGVIDVIQIYWTRGPHESDISPQEITWCTLAPWSLGEFSLNSLIREIERSTVCLFQLLLLVLLLLLLMTMIFRLEIVLYPFCNSIHRTSMCPPNCVICEHFDIFSKVSAPTAAKVIIVYANWHVLYSNHDLTLGRLFLARLISAAFFQHMLPFMRFITSIG